MPDRVPRWERRKESRPAELLAAALACFVDRGFAATRLDDVAARAGVSKGTLYLYYSSKDQLFMAVVRESIIPLIEAFQNEVTTSSATSAELLRRFVLGWWQQVGETQLAGIAKLVVAEAGNFPEVARFFHNEVAAPNRKLVASLIERGMRAGEFRAVDAEATAQLVLAPLVLQAIWNRSIQPCCGDDGSRLGIERILEAHLTTILRALLPTTGPDLR
ncbi:MAG: TetR/AcrR family transcriptional regulator [Betaproteobacteria bacterium]|nr:TetR/AcrR family transcriptional regulator [Betaproteobacteria bacterium]